MDKKNLPFKIISIVLGISASIIVAEIGIRIYISLNISSNSIMLSNNPELIFEHKPSIEFTNNYGINVRYNSMDFIGSEVGEKVPSFPWMSLYDRFGAPIKYRFSRREVYSMFKAVISLI